MNGSGRAGGRDAPSCSGPGKWPFSPSAGSYDLPPAPSRRHLLRRRQQAVRALTLTLTLAGNTSWTSSRCLTEPSAHDDDLRLLVYQLMDAACLQRFRLTALALKGEDLIDADQVAQQISLDDAREAHLVAETAIDRIRGAGTRV
ncbi:hypothetical protein [Streptomyces sp. YS415]|uniref:hypothetical protein n=1 Tax=Streptomyces sp. YS415 TaxID=2944806 RepID=UPI0027E254C7|nr:hypothetical protein [Streptomyces sp. YS415]